MGRKRIMETIFLGLWIMIAVILFVHYNKKYNNPVKIPDKLKIKNNLELNKIYDIKRITVLSGDSFDVVIYDDVESRLLSKLNLTAVADSKNVVLKLLNNSTNPKIKLTKKDNDGKWVVDILLTSEEKEINLSEWLVRQNLVYK
ncbi:MAG: hypothetical protein EKK64_02960 [Neisseriaceae bacterium]|nr:MAG: hypothetical protein EKK64_02960 [Neisseriaceae bacterium]